MRTLIETTHPLVFNLPNRKIVLHLLTSLTELKDVRIRS